MKNLNKNGVVFTPNEITNYIIENVSPTLNKTIFEPSVGTGNFIFTLLNYIKFKYKLTLEELKNYLINNVYGNDISKEYIDILKLKIVNYFKNSLTIEDLKENFQVKDTLKKEKRNFDKIIGNPPYIRTKNIDKETLNYLKENYKSCKSGNIDIYYAFIEFSYYHSKNFSLIVPNSWLYNKSAYNLRQLLKENIVEIVNFKNKQIFNKAVTYTSILTVDRNLKNNFLKFKEDIDINNLNNEFKLLKEKLNNDNWLLNKNFTKLKLQDKIIYHSPIATLRDNIFINHEFENSNNDVVPLKKLTKLKNAEEFNKYDKTIIFPYKLPNFELKKEKEFDIETINYLQKNLKELLKRDKGKGKYKYYEYGRKQGMKLFQENSYIIPIPYIININYQFFYLNTPKEIFLFTSGIIIEILNLKDANTIIKFLNSQEGKEYIKKNSLKLQGNNYFRLSKKLIDNMFLPNPKP